MIFRTEDSIYWRIRLNILVVKLLFTNHQLQEIFLGSYRDWINKFRVANYESFFICSHSKTTLFQLFRKPFITHTFQIQLLCFSNYWSYNQNNIATKHVSLILLLSLFIELGWHVIRIIQIKCNTDKTTSFSIVTNFKLRLPLKS